MGCRYFLFCCETGFYYVALAYTTMPSSFLLLLKVIQWVLHPCPGSYCSVKSRRLELHSPHTCPDTTSSSCGQLFKAVLLSNTEASATSCACRGGPLSRPALVGCLYCFSLLDTCHTTRPKVDQWQREHNDTPSTPIALATQPGYPPMDWKPPDFFFFLFWARTISRVSGSTSDTHSEVGNEGKALPGPSCRGGTERWLHSGSDRLQGWEAWKLDNSNQLSLGQPGAEVQVSSTERLRGSPAGLHPLPAQSPP